MQLKLRAEKFVRLIPALVAFVWPFLFFYNLVFLDGNSAYTGIGNDSLNLGFKHKFYFLSKIVNGELPLWAPSEAAGYPLFYNPFVQAIYPLNLLLLGLCKLNGGFDYIDYQRFIVLGVSIFCLGVYSWLKGSGFKPLPALFGALVVSSSLKISNMLRFVNYVHATAWVPWLFLAVTAIFQSRDKRQMRKYATLFGIFFFLFLSACYSYSVFHIWFILIPLTLVFAIRSPIPFFSKLQGLKYLAFGLIGPIVLCAPYYFEINEVLKTSVGRNQKSIGFSSFAASDLNAVFASWVYPALANMENWYYFGLLGVVLLISYFIFLTLSIGSPKDRTIAPDFALPGSFARSRFLVVGFFAIATFLTLLTYTSGSQIFMFFWNYLPGFARLRAWGRLNVLLLPLVAWGLALAYSHFMTLALHKKESKWGTYLRFFVAVAATLGGIVWIQYTLPKNLYPYFWRIYFYRAVPEVRFYHMAILSSVALVSLLGFSWLLRERLKQVRRFLEPALFCLLVFLTVFDIYPISTFDRAYAGKYPLNRSIMNTKKVNSDSFTTPRVIEPAPGEGISNTAAFNLPFMEDWHFQTYFDFWKWSEKQTQDRDILLGVKDGRKLFLSEKLDHDTIKSYLNDAMNQKGVISLKEYSGEKLTVEVATPVSAHLSFIDNIDPNWRVYVDGKKAPIERLFNTFKAVNLSEGSHQVEFRYVPRPLAFFSRD